MKNILVTGGSRGIGYGIVRHLCSEGHRVMAVARSGERLNDLKEACMKLKGECIVLHGDLTEDEFLKEIVTNVKGEFGQLDGLVNNAGMLKSGTLEEQKDDEIRRHFEINVISPMRLTGKLLPYIGKGGHIVNIGSMGGFQGSVKFSGLSVYSSTKAALACWTECMAEEYKDRGVAFNCLALGAVQTEMLAEAFPGYEAPVTAEEMGRYVAEFVVGGSKYISGKIIPVALHNPG